MKKAILTLAFSLFICTISHAAMPSTISWSKSWFGGAGTFDFILWDKGVANKVWAGADVSGLHVSTDAAVTWTDAGRNFLCIEVDGIFQSDSDHNTLYATCGNASQNAGYVGVVKSTDDGVTWTQKQTTWAYSRPTHYKMLAIDHSNPDIVYAATPIISGHSYIYKSVNGGTDWTLYDTDPFATTPVNLLLSADNNYLFATASAASGANVKVYNLGASTSQTYTLTGTYATYNKDIVAYTLSGTEHVCVAAGQKLACTTDHGANWTYSAAAVTGTNFIDRFDMLVSGSDIWTYASASPVANAYSSSLRVSQNGGTSWTTPTATLTANLAADPTLEGMLSFNRKNSVAINPANRLQVLSVNDWAIWGTSDWGANITNVDVGAQNTVVTSLAVAPNGWMFASGMDFGTMRSKDNGVTWEAICGSDTVYHWNSSSSDTFAGHHWKVITLGTEDDWNNRNGIVVVAATPWDVGDGHGALNVILRSTDNGDTWTRISSTLPTVQMYNGADWVGYDRSFAVCPSDPTVLALGIEGENVSPGPAQYGGIWISTDSGLNWVKATGYSMPTAPERFRRALAFDPTDATCQKMALGTLDGSVKVTTDRFTTYTTVSIGGIQNLVYRPGTSDWYATTFDRKLYKGTTLIHTFNGLEGQASITDSIYFDPTNNKRAFVATIYPAKDSTLYMTDDISLDASSVWSSINSDLPSRQGVNAVLLNYTSSQWGKMFIATSGNGVYAFNMVPAYSYSFKGAKLKGFTIR